MPSRVGLRLETNDFKFSLGELPASLRGEAGHVLEGEANAAGVSLRRLYGAHVHSGTMQSRVTVTDRSTDTKASYRIRSGSPAAWWFDYGTHERYWTKHPSHKYTGRMWTRTAKPSERFVSIIEDARRAAWRQVIDLLRRNGLLVTGDAQ